MITRIFKTLFSQNTLLLLFLSFFLILATKVHSQCVDCNGTSTNGSFSSAIGTNNHANGDFSFAAGENSKANGRSSFSLGQRTNVYENYALGIGRYLEVYGSSSMAIGRFLKTLSPDAMVIGYGFSETQTLDNNIDRSLMIGFESTKPTLFVGPSNGINSPDGSSMQRNCYDNSNEFCELYGGLYTWHTAMNGELSGFDIQGICPDGWHLPNNIDFNMLRIMLSSNESGNLLKSCRQIDSPLEGNCNTNEHPRWEAYPLHYGTDDYGFSALPGGIWQNGTYHHLGKHSNYWLSTEEGDIFAYAFIIRWDRPDVYSNIYGKTHMLSIRCIKEGATYGK
jgi:uncharacterized protein (TIGR02145 family)